MQANSLPKAPPTILPHRFVFSSTFLTAGGVDLSLHCQKKGVRTFVTGFGELFEI
jgi:hypothetical protein